MELKLPLAQNNSGALLNMPRASKTCTAAIKNLLIMAMPKLIELKFRLSGTTLKI